MIEATINAASSALSATAEAAGSALSETPAFLSKVVGSWPSQSILVNVGIGLCGGFVGLAGYAAYQVVEPTVFGSVQSAYDWCASWVVTPAAEEIDPSKVEIVDAVAA